MRLRILVSVERQLDRAVSDGVGVHLQAMLIQREHRCLARRQAIGPARLIGRDLLEWCGARAARFRSPREALGTRRANETRPSKADATRHLTWAAPGRARGDRFTPASERRAHARWWRGGLPDRCVKRLIE